MEHRISAVVFREGKFFVARGIEIELASQGKSVEQALENLSEAFKLWLKHADPEDLEMITGSQSPLVTQVVAA